MSGFIINPYRFAGGGGGGELTYAVTSISTDGQVVNSALRYGWVFTVGASNLAVTELGHYAESGLQTATYRVMIHRNSDENVMASADIESVLGQRAVATIAEVTLATGVTYTVSARTLDANNEITRNPTTVNYATELTVDNDGVFGDADDTRPTSNSANVYVPPGDFGFTV